jgi:hypothetical protein
LALSAGAALAQQQATPAQIANNISQAVIAMAQMIERQQLEINELREKLTDKEKISPREDKR